MWEERENVGGEIMWVRRENVGKERECGRRERMWEERENVGGERECGRRERMWEGRENVGDHTCDYESKPPSQHGPGYKGVMTALSVYCVVIVDFTSQHPLLRAVIHTKVHTIT